MPKEMKIGFSILLCIFLALPWVITSVMNHQLNADSIKACVFVNAGSILFAVMLWSSLWLDRRSRKKAAERAYLKKKQEEWDKIRADFKEFFDYELPFTEMEFLTKRVSVVLEAQPFVNASMTNYAYDYWEAAQRKAKIQSQVGNPAQFADQEQEIEKTEQAFNTVKTVYWEADALAKKIGCTTKPRFKDWLPFPNVMH